MIYDHNFFLGFKRFGLFKNNQKQCNHIYLAILLRKSFAGLASFFNIF